MAFRDYVSVDGWRERNAKAKTTQKFDFIVIAVAVTVTISNRLEIVFDEKRREEKKKTFELREDDAEIDLITFHNKTRHGLSIKFDSTTIAWFDR